MRSALLILVASTAYIATAMPMDDIREERTDSRFVEFSDDDGNIHTIDLEAEPDYDLIDDFTRNPANTRYFLFTRRNPRNSQTLTMNDANSIRNSHYRSNLQTVFISHGWLGNQKADLNPTIRDAYLARFDVNIVVVDWTRLSLTDYVTAMRGVPAVGRGVGQFINFVIRTVGGNLNNFHLIGFSLGGHLVGNAGRELGGRVARVTGLDPAGPLWANNNQRLNRNDGLYVEAIHTDGGLNGLGIGSAVADADFFPNGGTNQPGCLTGVCDHNRAWELFAATVTHNHLVANHCADTSQVRNNNCRGARMNMGNADLRKNGRGLHRVNTGRRYPF